MKIAFPDPAMALRILAIALVLAAFGYFLVPVTGLNTLDPRMLFAGGLLAGALIGGLLARLQFARREESGTESIFVGNLAFRMPPDALRELFEQYGEVHAVRLMTDRVTRKPRGFGFVVMNKRDARAAIKALNGKEFFGRQLKVNVAHERKPRPEQQQAA